MMEMRTTEFPSKEWDDEEMEMLAKNGDSVARGPWTRLPGKRLTADAGGNYPC